MNNNAKVLIVDDLKEMRELLVDIVKEYGYRTIAANNGLSAIELYRRELPDAGLWT